MKNLFVLMSILMLVLCGSINISAETEDEKALNSEEEVAVKPDADAEKIATDTDAEKIVTDANAISDANATLDANAPFDPNAIEERFPDVAKAVSIAARSGRKEATGWRSLKAEGGADLLKSAREQITAELNLIRKFAEEEGAVKTKAAIDLLLIDRADRFEKIIEKLEREEERLQERKQRSQDREGRRRIPRERESRSPD